MTWQTEFGYWARPPAHVLNELRSGILVDTSSRGDSGPSFRICYDDTRRLVLRTRHQAREDDLYHVILHGEDLYAGDSFDMAWAEFLASSILLTNPDSPYESIHEELADDEVLCDACGAYNEIAQFYGSTALRGKCGDCYGGW